MRGWILSMLLLFSCGGSWGQASVETEMAKRTELELVESSLTEEERAVSGDMVLDGSYDTAGALHRLWARFLLMAKETAKNEFSFAWKLVLIAALAAAVMILSPDPRIGNHAELAACCSAALLLTGSAESVISQASAALYRLSDYGKAAFPAFFMTAAACGQSVSASVRYASVSFVSNLFMELTQRFLMPLLYAYLSVAVTGCLAENALLNAAEKFLKWCAVSVMTVINGGFCTYISLSGLIAGSADATAVKATKTVIATLLPVVGGILSDSASTVLSAATVIKNSAGVFCLIAVCAICSGPLALLLVKMLFLKAAAVLSEMGSCKRYARLLGSIGNVMGMLLGMVGSYGVMLFYSFMSALRAAG